MIKTSQVSAIVKVPKITIYSNSVKNYRFNERGTLVEYTKGNDIHMFLNCELGLLPMNPNLPYHYEVKSIVRDYLKN